jgi:hypothetical protein
LKLAAEGRNSDFGIRPSFGLRILAALSHRRSGSAFGLGNVLPGYVIGELMLPCFD